MATKSRREIVETALRGFASGDQLDEWMSYYDRVWTNEPEFDAHMFLLHSWDHEYFETDDFKAAWDRFRARLKAAQS